MFKLNSFSIRKIHSAIKFEVRTFWVSKYPNGAFSVRKTLRKFGYSVLGLMALRLHRTFASKIWIVLKSSVEFCFKFSALLPFGIQPTTCFRTSPNKPSFDFGAADAATSDSISLTVSKDMNGVQIQCGNRYERSNMGGKPLELKSRVATLDISFPTEMDDVSSTPNEDPITVELGKQTKLECAFVGNPPVEPSSKITWTRVSICYCVGNKA